METNSNSAQMSNSDAVHAGDFGEWLSHVVQGDADLLRQLMEQLFVGYRSASSDVDSRKDMHLDNLWLLAGIREAVDGYLPGIVGAAKYNEASWDEIGRALGISRQAAQQRYGR